jgi:hypothetical protein
MSFDLYTISLPASSSDRPTVTLIVANSLRHGTQAGLLNVAGTQLGLAPIVAVVGIGLTSVIELMGCWFDVLRLIGAACASGQHYLMRSTMSDRDGSQRVWDQVRAYSRVRSSLSALKRRAEQPSPPGQTRSSAACHHRCPLARSDGGARARGIAPVASRARSAHPGRNRTPSR